MCNELVLDILYEHVVDPIDSPPDPVSRPVSKITCKASSAQEVAAILASTFCFATKLVCSVITPLYNKDTVIARLMAPSAITDIRAIYPVLYVRQIKKDICFIALKKLIHGNNTIHR
jgi:hypothetical protein